MERGSGRTSRQMLAVPYGGIFIWCNNRTEYAVALAKFLGRQDLQIKSPFWVIDAGFTGLRAPGIQHDHALFGGAISLRDEYRFRAAWNEIQRILAITNGDPPEREVGPVTMAWIRKNYRVPAQRGGRVEYAGNRETQHGEIVGARGGYLRIRLDGETQSFPFHPTWRLRYLGAGSPAGKEAP